MKFFIKLCLVFIALLSISQNLSSAEKKNCSEYKKLSKEYLAWVTNKIGKTIDKNLKIDVLNPCLELDIKRGVEPNLD